jgi:hypothetical protein
VLILSPEVIVLDLIYHVLPHTRMLQRHYTGGQSEAPSDEEDASPVSPALGRQLSKGTEGGTDDDQDITPVSALGPPITSGSTGIAAVPQKASLARQPTKPMGSLEQAPPLPSGFPIALERQTTPFFPGLGPPLPSSQVLQSAPSSSTESVQSATQPKPVNVLMIGERVGLRYATS